MNKYKKMRAEMGLSLRAEAQLLNVSVTSIWFWEHGRKAPREKSITKIKNLHKLFAKIKKDKLFLIKGVDKL